MVLPGLAHLYFSGLLLKVTGSNGELYDVAMVKATGVYTRQGVQ